MDSFTPAFPPICCDTGLLPNATYFLGLLPAALLASLPIWLVMYIVLRSNRMEQWNAVRLGLILAALLVLFFGGLLVSLKICGTLLRRSLVQHLRDPLRPRRSPQRLVLQHRETGRVRAETVEQVDLALDLWINPDGSYQVLGRDEFEALNLDQTTRLRAQQAVAELIYMLYHRAAPFTAIDQPRAL